MKVRDIMTNHVCCVSPDMTLENASKLMCGADIGVVPVCDSSGIVGILTDRDIITRGISQGCASSETVARVMTKSVASISPDADIKEAERRSWLCFTLYAPVTVNRIVDYVPLS